MLSDGQAFGELALFDNKPRMANVFCYTDVHLAVLNKVDFHHVIGVIEKKAYLEKIAFLRSIPIFSKLTKTSLGKMTFCF